MFGKGPGNGGADSLTRWERTAGFAVGGVREADGGNKRWGDGKLQYPGRHPGRREFVADEQDPFGVILSCRPGRRHRPRARKQTSADLRADKDLAPLVKKGALAVVSAYYSLDTGRVEVPTDALSR